MHPSLYKAEGFAISAASCNKSKAPDSERKYAFSAYTTSLSDESKKRDRTSESDHFPVPVRPSDIDLILRYNLLSPIWLSHLSIIPFSSNGLTSPTLKHSDSDCKVECSFPPEEILILIGLAFGMSFIRQKFWSSLLKHKS